MELVRWSLVRAMGACSCEKKMFASKEDLSLGLCRERQSLEVYFVQTLICLTEGFCRSG
jgi:hypothetical protein